MAPNVEQELLEKVNAIYTSLFGLEGQPGSGEIPRLKEDVKDQGRRITALENWRWFVLGIAAVAVLLVQLVMRH